MKSLLLTLVLAATVHAEPFQVSGLDFTAPKDWTKAEAASPMRKAQFSIPGEKGAAELVFFHFGPGGAGGVQANLDRWFGQFQEPKERIDAKTEKAKAGKFDVTYATARGTFMAGPPMGQKVAQPNSALLGAIIEHPDGAIFAKMTGPIETVEAATAAFKTMIANAK